MLHFQELEKMGILRTDPRLEPLIETLKMIKRKTFGAIYGIDNIKLDFNQFQKYGHFFIAEAITTNLFF